MFLQGDFYQPFPLPPLPFETTTASRSHQQPPQQRSFNVTGSTTTSTLWMGEMSPASPSYNLCPPSAAASPYPTRTSLHSFQPAQQMQSEAFHADCSPVLEPAHWTRMLYRPDQHRTQGVRGKYYPLDQIGRTAFSAAASTSAMMPMATAMMMMLPSGQVGDYFQHEDELFSCLQDLCDPEQRNANEFVESVLSPIYDSSEDSASFPSSPCSSPLLSSTAPSSPDAYYTQLSVNRSYRGVGVVAGRAVGAPAAPPAVAAFSPSSCSSSSSLMVMTSSSLSATSSTSASSSSSSSSSTSSMTGECSWSIVTDAEIKEGPQAVAAQQQQQEAKARKRRGKKRKKPPTVCTECRTTETPEWRRGPDGPRTLCNACGLRYAKRKRRRRLQMEKEKMEQEKREQLLAAASAQAGISGATASVAMMPVLFDAAAANPAAPSPPPTSSLSLVASETLVTS